MRAVLAIAGNTFREAIRDRVLYLFLGFALLLLVSLPMLVGLSHFSGFEDTVDWREDVMDALTAFAVGVLTSAAMLSLFAIVGRGMPGRQLLGTIAVQAVPASRPAALAMRATASSARRR